jgi:hypothetical protein
MSPSIRACFLLLSMVSAGCSRVVRDDDADTNVTPDPDRDAPASPSGDGSAPASCASGRALTQLWVEEDSTAIAVVVDAIDVYATVEGYDGAPGGVVAVPKEGGEPRWIAQTKSGSKPWSIAQDASHVYWIEDARELRRAPKAGGGSVLLATDGEPGEGGPGIEHIAVDDTHVYYAWAGGGGEVRRVPKVGGSVESFAVDQAGPSSIAIDGDSVYWLNVGFEGQPLGSLKRAPKAGGPEVTLAAGFRANAAGTPSLAIDAEAVYWSASVDGTLGKVSKLGGEATVLASGVEAQGLVVVDDTLYFTAPFVSDVENARHVYALSSSGGALVEVAASNQFNPWGIAVDDHFVFWSSYVTTGPIFRACR